MCPTPRCLVLAGRKPFISGCVQCCAVTILSGQVSVTGYTADVPYAALLGAGREETVHLGLRAMLRSYNPFRPSLCDCLHGRCALRRAAWCWQGGNPSSRAACNAAQLQSFPAKSL